jgi:hypothetical protein
MKLKSFGCSFIYGTDLVDDGRGYFIPNPDGTFTPRASQLTWPALLAQHLAYDYECYASPGSGNLQIADQVLNQIDNNTFYIISWSWIDRFDYTDSDTNKWQTIMPVDNNSTAQVYYRDIHSQFRDKLTTLMNIKIVIDTLKQHNCPFIMTYMDELIFETEWHTNRAIKDLQDYVCPHMTTFNGKTFLEWSRKNNYPESTHWHPLEVAHSAAKDYMIKVFDTKNTNAHWHLV